MRGRGKMIREIMTGFALLLFLICVNVAWQNLHCGTPVCKTAPLQLIPCEPAGEIKAEIDYLERMARERPAR